MKYIYICLGFFFLGLGIIGIFLPILPTVPFLLLASYFFAKGSTHFHKWFMSTKIYSKYLKEFEVNKSLSLKNKWRILALVSVMLAVPFFSVNNMYMKIGILILVVAKYYIILCRIQTSKE
jgi:uncharacterized protein